MGLLMGFGSSSLAQPAGRGIPYCTFPELDLLTVPD
jgi:hypothetical protein